MRKELASGEILFRQGDPERLGGAGPLGPGRGAARDRRGRDPARHGARGRVHRRDGRARGAAAQRHRARRDRPRGRADRAHRVPRAGQPRSGARAQAADPDEPPAAPRRGPPGAASTPAATTPGRPALAGARPALELRAATYAAKFYVGLEPIAIEHLPFTVGRAAGPDEVVAGGAADLAIAEPSPIGSRGCTSACWRRATGSGCATSAASSARSSTARRSGATSRTTAWPCTPAPTRWSPAARARRSSSAWS